MKEVSSFIDQVVTNAASKAKSGIKPTAGNRNSNIARLVQAADHPQVANRIAIVWDNLAKERKSRSVEAVQSGVPAIEMFEKPEHLLSFVQQMMNNCCWAARGVINSGKGTDLANGLDFSQSIAEQAGQLESSSVQDCESTLMQDWSTLNHLHSWLCSEMNYMADLDPLYLYSEKAEVSDGVWEHVHTCMDINEVLPILNEKALELTTLGESKVTETARTMEFGKTGPIKGKAKAKAKAA